MGIILVARKQASFGGTMFSPGQVISTDVDGDSLRKSLNAGRVMLAWEGKKSTGEPRVAPPKKAAPKKKAVRK